MTPNMAYVTDAPEPGRTVKACERSLLNLRGGGFGGSPLISHGGHSFLTLGEYRAKALSVVKPHEELEPLEHDHPLRQLWDTPNSWDTTYDFVYELGMFLELTGVCYEWLIPNGFNRPAERWVIPSHWVWPRTGGGQAREPYWSQRPGWEEGHHLVPYDNPHADELIAYYEVRPWGGMGSAGMLRIPPNEIVMTQYKSPINKIDGYSKLSAGAQWIDIHESLVKSQYAQFINQARPELWIELGAGYEDPNDDRIARVEAKLAAKFQGEYNTGRPIVAPPGAKLNVLSFDPQRMAYTDNEEQSRDRILSLWRVPKTAVGLSTEMTFGSILATLAALCSECINPKLTMLGLKWTKELGKRYDETTPAWSTLVGRGHGSRSFTRKVRVWYDDCFPVDPTQVNADIETDLHSYAITPDEVRALRGRKPYKRGNNPLAQGPGGIAPLPLNEDEDLSELAELMKPMAELGSEGEGDDAGSGMLAGTEAGASDGKLTSRLPRSQAGDGRSTSSGTASPNKLISHLKPTAGTKPEESEEDTDAKPVNRLRSSLQPSAKPPKEPNGKPQKKSLADSTDPDEVLEELARRFWDARSKVGEEEEEEQPSEPTLAEATNLPAPAPAPQTQEIEVVQPETTHEGSRRTVAVTILDSVGPDGKPRRTIEIEQLPTGNAEEVQRAAETTVQAEEETEREEQRPVMIHRPLGG